MSQKDSNLVYATARVLIDNVKCPFCKNSSNYEVELSDVHEEQLYSGSDIDYGSSRAVIVRCPHCRRTLELQV